MKPSQKRFLSELPWRLGACLVALVYWCQVQEAKAQTLQQMYAAASGAAQEGKFGQAAATYEKAIKDHGEFAWEDYGPTFGGIYYDMGMCLLQLARYEEAIAAFRTCHEEFPPSDKIPYGPRDKVPKIDSANTQWKKAVFQWGYAVQMMGDYQAALDLYQKYMDLKPDAIELKPIYPALMLRRGKCLLSTGRTEEGEKEVTQIFENSAKYQASGQVLFQGMLDLAIGWVEEAKKGGDRLQLTAKGNQFLDKYGSLFSISPYEKLRLGFADRLRRLGLEAQQAGLHVLALRFFAMAPTTQAVIADLKARAAQSSGPARAGLEQIIGELEAKVKSPDPAELETLRVIAAAWEGLGNSRTGFVVNRFLVERYPLSSAMPQMLHEAARYAFNLGDPSAAQYYGERYMEIPATDSNSNLRGNVSAFMLQSLFRTGQYELCVSTAGKMREGYPEGDPARELPDFIYGVALYSLGKVEEAEKAITLHVDKYPTSSNRETARFFQASVKIVLEKYPEAVPLLDSFLKDYETSKFRDQALFYRSVSHYMAKEYPQGLKLLDQVAEDFPNSTVLARVYNLKGDTMRALAYHPAEGKVEADYWKDAKAAYDQAKQTAERLGQAETRAESLYKLVDTCLDLEMWPETVAAYDAFLEQHRGNPYEAQVSVFALTALEKVGRTEDGLVQLEKVIQELSEKNDIDMLSKAIGSYQKVAVEARGVDKTIAIYDQMLSKGNQALQTQLLISKLSLYQDQRRKFSRDEAMVAKCQAEIDVIFKKLLEYKPEQLSDAVLQAIGRYFEESNPFKAQPYFLALLDRKDDLYKAPAEMALGRIEKSQNNPNAVQRFIRVIDFYGKDPKYEAQRMIPEAHVNIGEIAVASGDWDLAEKYLVPYINNKQWDTGLKDRRAKAQYLYAYTLEMRKKDDEAIQVYNALFGAYPGYPEWSAKAVERGFNISYKRDYPTPEEKRAKQVQAYTFLRVALYTWQKLESGKFDALDRLRLVRDRVEGELGLDAAEIRQIELSRGLVQP